MAGPNSQNSKTKPSIVRIARIPTRVTLLSKFPALAIASLLSQVLRSTYRTLWLHKFHLTFVVVMVGLLLQGAWAMEDLNRMPVLDAWLLLPCQDSTNNLVANMTETDKVAGAAGTTLMTLLPALLVFGPFPTAEISTMIAFSTWPALITSGFTLGLAASKMVTLGKNRILRVMDLCTQGMIEYYGQDTSFRSGIPQLYKFPIRAANLISDTNLLQPVTPEQDILDLRDVMNCALLEGNRPKRIYIKWMNFLFTFIQGWLMFALLLFSPRMIQINMVWGCENSAIPFVILLLWTPFMWILAALFCTFAESSFIRPDEIFHLSPLTATTALGDCDHCSLNAAPPPARVLGPVAQCRSVAMRNRGTFTFSSITTRKIQQYVLGIIPLLKNLVAIQKSPHPMILILRPATDTGRYGKRPGALLCGVLGGLLQALLLIALTIFFGSTFGPGILQAAFFVTYFVGVTVTSRTYSIYHCLWMEQALSAMIIEYRTPTEYRAIKVIIAGMPSAVVENLTDGSTYGDGYRLDHNPQCPAHPPTSSRPCPRTFGRLAGLVLAIFFVPPMVYVFNIYVGLPPAFNWNPLAAVIVVSFAIFVMGVCVISTMISEFDSVDIYRGNSSGVTAAYGPVSQV